MKSKSDWIKTFVREQKAVGIDISNLSDEEIEKQIEESNDKFKDEAIDNMDELALAYDKMKRS